MDHSYSMEAQGVNCQRHLSYSIINRLEAIELRSSLSLTRMTVLEEKLKLQRPHQVQLVKVSYSSVVMGTTVDAKVMRTTRRQNLR